MTTEKKKKNKSVERVKVNNTVMNDSNLNNQSVQIIFPSDTEIRKVKKKPKRKTGKSKSEKEKDELLEQLKEDLKTYDSVQQEAVEKKVKIPQELGVSTITKADLKKNDDIKLFISDVVNKTQKMRELIATAEQKLSQPSRGFPLRLGGGINRFANLPSVFPQQPEIIQPQVIPPTPIPSQIPQKIPTAPKSDEKLEALKKIAEETKEQLEKSGVDVPINPPSDPSTTADDSEPSSPISGQLLPDPSKPVIRPPQVPKLPLPVPSVPQDEPDPQTIQPPPVDTTGYESNTLKNGQTVITPPGWYDIYRKFEFDLKNLQFVTQQNQKLPGVYHIPLTRYNNFKIAQTNILTEYSKYFDSLRPQDRKYILTEPMVKAVDTAMKNDFKKEPKDLMIELFTEQKIPFKEITQGNEVPELETAIQQQGLKDAAKQKSLELFEKKLATETNALIRLNSKIETLNAEQINNALKELSDTEDEIIFDYNKLDPIVRLGVENGKEKLLKRISEMKIKLDQRLQRLPNPNDIPTLKKYLENTNTYYTIQGQDSIASIIMRLFGTNFASSIQSKNAPEKRKLIAKKLKEYQDKQPVAGVQT
jgi:hypothetical protein